MNSIQFTVLGEPYGKGRPRFNRFTGTAHTPEKTESREALVGYEYRRQCGTFRFPDTAMLDMRILAYYSVPKGDSKATRAAKLEGFIRPTKKPDIEIVRGGRLFFAFRIHPLNADDYNRCREKHTKYVRNKQLGMKLPENTDSTKYRSEIIYQATVKEDREKLWDNKTVWEALRDRDVQIMGPLDVIEYSLLAGEKDRVLEAIDQLSGFDTNLEEVAKN